MSERISDIFDYGDEIVIVEERDDRIDPARIKELTMKKINSGAVCAEIGKTVKKARPAWRTVLIAAAVGVLLIGTALAVVTGFSDGLRELLHVTEDEAAMAESSGLLSTPAASDTSGGVTVSVEQAVADGSNAFVALRIEGFEIPEGSEPVWREASVMLDGELPADCTFITYADMKWDGEGFVYSDGTPAALTEEGTPVPRYMRPDGSIELDLHITAGADAGDTLIGREVSVTIPRLGIAPVDYRYTPDEEVEYAAEGPWTLTWTLEGSDNVRIWEPNASLGDTGAAVTHVTLSALSIEIEYDFPLRYFDEIAFDGAGNEVRVKTVLEPPRLYSIVMKDGTEYTDVLGGGAFGYHKDNQDHYRLVMSLTHIIDPDEVTALVFRENFLGDVPDSEVELYTVALSD